MALQPPTGETGEQLPQESFDLETNFGNTINLQFTNEKPKSRRREERIYCNFTGFDYGEVIVETEYAIAFPEIEVNQDGRRIDITDQRNQGTTLHFVSQEGEYASVSFGNPNNPDLIIASEGIEPCAQFLMDLYSQSYEGSSSKTDTFEKVILALARQFPYLSSMEQKDYIYHSLKFMEIAADKLSSEKLLELKASLADFEHFWRVGGNWKKFEKPIQVDASTIRKNRPVNEIESNEDEYIRRYTNILINAGASEDSNLSPKEKVMLFNLTEGLRAVDWDKTGGMHGPHMLIHSIAMNNGEKYLSRIFPEIKDISARTAVLASSLMTIAGPLIGGLSEIVVQGSGWPMAVAGFGMGAGTSFYLIAGYPYNKRMQIINKLINERFGQSNPDEKRKNSVPDSFSVPGRLILEEEQAQQRLPDANQTDRNTSDKSS